MELTIHCGKGLLQVMEEEGIKSTYKELTYEDLEQFINELYSGPVECPTVIEFNFKEEQINIQL